MKRRCYAREFVVEVAGSIYKAFEMDSFDGNKLKEITVERTRIFFLTKKLIKPYLKWY